VTGLSMQTTDLAGKRLELLREVVPGLRLLAIMAYVSNSGAVCAPAGWDPGSEEWEVCPCGWRPELGKHYAKAGHVQWWREQIKERGSLEAVYREVRKRQRDYRRTDVG
jgi:hypothetical protein